MTTDALQNLQETVQSWSSLTDDEQETAFRSLARDLREELFLGLTARDKAELALRMPAHERRTYMRVLPPDDAVDVIQGAEEEGRGALVETLDPAMRREVNALLAYAEDDAGGLMSPRFARLRPEMTVDEAISYLRLQSRHVETLYYAYVLDPQQRLLGVVSFRDLFIAAGDRRVDDFMERDVVAVEEETDQEQVAKLTLLHDLAAIPVLGSKGRMKGIITVDDIVDVVREEASEDIQKMGGMEALEAPYFDTGFWDMLRKRAGWLAILFLGGLLTASAMDQYEHVITQVIMLAIFIPLIIASGGNSGAQASTLVIRAMALGEVRPKDWWKVARRELLTGLALGAVLAILGIVAVLVGQAIGGMFGQYYILIALTVSSSLIGVVLFGTVIGAMLPFALRQVGLDPASASAPFVATLVDLTGIVIYFSVAIALLGGKLL
jgi:magnesium transporter